MLKLAKPSMEYKESFLEAMKESDKGEIGYFADKSKVESSNFTKYIQELEDMCFGKNLPKGYVPVSTLWLVDGKEYIGRLSVRHTLTKWLEEIGGHVGYNIRPSKRRQGYGSKILELGIPKIKELGFEKFLITCDEDLIASKKIIEKNGGKLENKISQGKNKPKKLRYWIEI